MADRQFNPLGKVAAPALWTLPAGLQIQLKNAYASFDGTSAAGSFVPCLTVLSDSGHTVGSYPCGTTVAAGGSADVTWAPFLRNATTPGKVSYLTYQKRTASVNVAVPISGTPTTVDYLATPYAFTAGASDVFKLEVMALAWEFINATNGDMYLQAVLDGVATNIANYTFTTTARYIPLSSFWIFQPGAGSHTINARFSAITSGTSPGNMLVLQPMWLALSQVA